jgi:hypothetical protein
VAVGIPTLVAVHRLAARLTGDVRVADLAAFFYIVCPFTLFHDRMVLTDPTFRVHGLTLPRPAARRHAPAPRRSPRAAMALGIAAKVPTASSVSSSCSS